MKTHHISPHYRLDIRSLPALLGESLAPRPSLRILRPSQSVGVYLRQPSERQVKENTESQRLQSALAQRAREFGGQVVETLDTDLGRSAAIGAGAREGAERLIASVALGAVGLVLSRDGRCRGAHARTRTGANCSRSARSSRP